MHYNPFWRRLFQAITITALFLISITAIGQNKYSQSTGSSIKISGTSTLHSWEMTSNQLKSHATFDVNGQNQLTKLSNLSFSLAAKSLKSDNQRLDNNAYKALNTDKFDEIIFKTGNTKFESNTAQGSVKVSGELQISGTTKKKTIEATCVVQNSNQIRCTGETTLLMTDFGVTPPSFMLGAMKTGDEITISYDIIYKK